MAKRKFILASLLISLATSGCEQTPAPISSLPPPSFDAPKLAAAQPTTPLAPLPQITSNYPNPKNPSSTLPPRFTPRGSVPMGWVPPVAPRPWRWIVVHHSATTTGGAAAFDKMHRAKGWDELGYDFVIGNGTDTGDGQIEVGSRWTKQKIGAHAKTPDNRFNEYGIGICLVGNFDVERPTPAQMRSLTKLVGYLMKTYRITPDDVLGHRDTKPTECPGRYVNIPLIRQQASMIADAGSFEDRTEASTTGELLIDKH